jgi:hypothetical protein
MRQDELPVFYKVPDEDLAMPRFGVPPGPFSTYNPPPPYRVFRVVRREGELLALSGEFPSYEQLNLF